MGTVPTDSFAKDMAFIEYVHVVAYFNSNPHSALATSFEIARRVEESIGIGPVGLFALASPGEPPGRGWKDAMDSQWQSDMDCASVADLMANVEVNVDERRLSCAMVSCDRQDAKEKFIDYLWAVRYHAEDDYPQFQWDADLVTTIRLNLFDDEDSGRRASRELIDEIVRRSLTAGDVYYLIVDVAEMGMTGADGTYMREGTLTLAPTSLARAVEKHIWEELREKRRSRVRGVFWGNYLNPDILSRLGGRDAFAKRFRAQAKQSLLNHESLLQETEGGGVFVKISRDPMDESSRHGVTHLGSEMAAWLHRELQQIGALI